MGLEKGRNIILVWCYISILFWAVYKLSFEWGYQGIYFYTPSVETFLFSYLIAIIPVFFLPERLILPSDYVNIYIYIFTFIPSASIPFVLIKPGKFNDEYYIFVLVFLISLLYLLRKSSYKQHFLSCINPIPVKVLPIITAGLYIGSFALFVSTFGFKFSIPSLSDVYDVRAQYKEITEGNVIPRYVVGWMGYIINIFLLLYALQTRNLKLLIFSVAFQLYIFTLMALKSHLATYVLAAVLFFVFERYRSLSSFKFLTLTVVFILSLSFIDFIIGNDLLEMLITRRIMVIPSQLTYYHFDFFDHHPKTHWAFSVFKNILSYPYKMPPPNIIGEKHFGNEKMTAVVNLFIEGYTAFGYLGVILVTLLLKELLKAIDYIFLKRSGRNTIIIIILLVLCNIINSTSIFTMLLTHGWFILILLISIFPWKILRRSS